MNEAMKQLRAKAQKVMSQEQTFDSEETALKEALKQCRNLDNLISVWKAPDGKYVIVQFDNREHAGNCGYTEVYDTGTLYDKVKEKYDNIKEV